MTRKAPKNNNKAWTAQDKQQLEKLANGNTPTRIIAMKLERTENAIRNQAANLEISLKPTNQSPYNRKP